MKKTRFISKKIKAFTLMELVTGMLLTTITAAAGFSMYLYFIKTIKKHTSDEEMVKNLYSYYFYLENDLQNAIVIKPIENGIQLINRKKEKIIYRLEDTLLIRKVSEKPTETFMLRTSSFDFPEEMTNDMIITFSIEQRFNKKVMKWNWKKEYSSAENINQYIIEDGH